MFSKRTITIWVVTRDGKIRLISLIDWLVNGYEYFKIFSLLYLFIFEVSFKKINFLKLIFYGKFI